MNRSRNKCLLYGCLFLAMLGGCEDPESPAPAGTALAAPKELTAKAEVIGSITLNWNEVEDAKGYIIQYSTDSDSYTVLTAVSGITHMDSMLNAGQTRYYKVQAYNEAGMGPLSDVASVTTLDNDTSSVTIEVNGRAAKDVDIFQNEQKTFMVIGNYADCTWYVNGENESTESSFTFDAGSRIPGEVCEITVTVTDAVTGEKRSGSTRVEIK